MSSRKLAIAIIGPTASGKTKLGVAIAKAYLGEIISVDSLQCYKPGGILTAKPHPEEMEGVPHHLIDYLEADEEPRDFVPLAVAILKDISSRGRLPILVGGSTSLTIPLLQEVFDRDYEVLALTLVPHRWTYQRLVESRCVDMLKRGLLSELAELHRLEKELLHGKSDFGKGVWKAIGYREFLPHLKAMVSLDGEPNSYKDSQEKGRASMNASTVQYGHYQLEWMQHSLVPFLHRHKAVANHISLPVTDKASWLSEVERPAMIMAGQFCHGSWVTKLSPRASSKRHVVHHFYEAESPFCCLSARN